MCGICALISKCNDTTGNFVKLPNLLLRRGPDGFGKTTVTSSGITLQIFASVLSCRSISCSQPIIDQFNSIFAWNGEIFDGLAVEDENDALVLSNHLSHCSTVEAVVDMLRRVQGPYSFVFWHNGLKMMFFGRDVLGRRSLVVSCSESGENLLVTSTFSACSSFNTGEELLPTGIFCFRVDEKFPSELTLYCYKWPESDNQDLVKSRLPSVLHRFFRSIHIEVIENPLLPQSVVENDSFHLPSSEVDLALKDIASAFSDPENSNVDFLPSLFEKYLTIFPELDSLLDDFIVVFRESLKKRCRFLPKKCLDCAVNEGNESCGCHCCKVGVLFSGGLDSTIVACLADENLPVTEERLDLLNVAFFSTTDGGNTQKTVPPDRETANTVIHLLKDGSREVHLINVDVSQEELQFRRRERIRELILPCDTILDDSLGCALWFATDSNRVSNKYTSPAKILLHGLGADELFAGYSKHRASFQNGGWSAVEACLFADVVNLPHRNLGRDDRVASDNSRELRHPFLDENVVRSLMPRVPVFLRFNPYLPRAVGDKIFLRFVAVRLANTNNRWHDCLLKAAGFPKRAIQFGSRIANIEKERVKKSTKSSRRINASNVSETLLDDTKILK